MREKLYLKSGKSVFDRVGAIGARKAMIMFSVTGVLITWTVLHWGSSSNEELLTTPSVIGDIEDTVVATGTLKPLQLVGVGAQVSGRITSLKVSMGQDVKKGEPLAEIDSISQRNALLTAQAQLANARAQRDEKFATLSLANATFARQQVLLPPKATSRSDFDAAEAAVKTVQAQIAALNAKIEEGEVAVEVAEVNLSYTQITAPIAGRVLAVVAQEGQTVNALQSAPIIVILGFVDLMMVRAEISEVDVPKVRVGQKAYFTILGEPKRRYDTTLQAIEAAPESIRNDTAVSTSSSATSGSSSSTATSTSSSAVYYNAVLVIPNGEGRLLTYMTAQVSIVLEERQGVILVPAAAVDTVGSSTVVVVVDSTNHTLTKQVEIGINNKNLAEVRSGLSVGERVVIGRKSSTPRLPSMPGPPPIGF